MLPVIDRWTDQSQWAVGFVYVTFDSVECVHNQSDIIDELNGKKKSKIKNNNKTLNIILIQEKFTS